MNKEEFIKEWSKELRFDMELSAEEVWEAFEKKNFGLIIQALDEAYHAGYNDGYC